MWRRVEVVSESPWDVGSEDRGKTGFRATDVGAGNVRLVLDVAAVSVAAPLTPLKAFVRLTLIPRSEARELMSEVTAAEGVTLAEDRAEATEEMRYVSEVGLVRSGIVTALRVLVAPRVTAGMMGIIQGFELLY